MRINTNQDEIMSRRVKGVYRLAQLAGEAAAVGQPGEGVAAAVEGRRDGGRVGRQVPEAALLLDHGASSPGGVDDGRRLVVVVRQHEEVVDGEEVPTACCLPLAARAAVVPVLCRRRRLHLSQPVAAAPRVPALLGFVLFVCACVVVRV
jgi:hypothetical protein